MPRRPLPAARCLSMLAAAALSAVACGQHSRIPIAPPTSRPMVEDPAERLERAKAEMAETLESWRSDVGVPGVVAAFVLPDGRSFSLAAGDARIDPPGGAMTVDHRMFTGQTGDLIASAVVLKLVEQGRLSLDATIDIWLADQPWLDRLPNAHDITLRHLLNHTSGLPDHTLLPASLEQVRTNGDEAVTPSDVVQYVLDQSPRGEVGERYLQSNVNAALVAVVVERVMQRSIDDLAREWFLAPHGLDDLRPASERDPAGLPECRVRENSIFGLPVRAAPDGVYAVTPGPRFAVNNYVGRAEDLAQFAHVLFREGLLEYDTMREMLRFVEGDVLMQTRIGLGVQGRQGVMGPTFGRSGWIPGYMTEVAYYPAYGVSAAVQVNTTDGVGPRTLQGAADRLGRLLVAWRVIEEGVSPR